MSQWWAMPMLLSGGLFVGGLVSIAWERVPAWRASAPVDFRTGFAHTLRRVDRLRPALLVVCLGPTVGFASGVGGAARTLAALAAGGLLSHHGRLGGLVGPDPAAAGRLRVGTATGGPRSVASPVTWRSPGPHCPGAGLLCPGRRRHRRVRTPTPTGSGTA
jgi:hypothetical protein